MRHFLQSADWADFHESLGTKVVRHQGSDSEFIALVEQSHGKAGRFISRFYVPYGPLASSSADLAKSIEAIEEAASLNKSDYIRIEPIGNGFSTALMEENGYVKRPRASQPENTSIITLKGKTLGEVVASMNATNRNLWRRNSGSEDPVQFRISYLVADIEPFSVMMDETSKRTGAVFHTKEYFTHMMGTLGSQQKCGIVIASHQGVDMASALFVVDEAEKTLYYLHAGSTAVARQYNAGNLLVAYLIQFAHECGLEYVDLFGVAPIDADESHSLYGISNFKRSFGGEDVTYNGTWEKGLTKKYKIMKLLR